MVTSTLTSKGQITIPKAVRDSLRLHSGDRVEFVVVGMKQAVMKPVKASVDDVFGMLHKPGRLASSVEEMKEAIRARMRKQFR